MGRFGNLFSKQNLVSSLVVAVAVFITTLLSGSSAVTDDGFDLTIPVGEHEINVTGEKADDGLMVCASFDGSDPFCHAFVQEEEEEEMPPPEVDAPEGTSEGTGALVPEATVEE